MATLRSGWLGEARVARFEEMFAGYVGTEHAVAVQLVHRRDPPDAPRRRGGRRRRGDHHPMTYCATAHSRRRSGFADDPRSSAAIEAAIGPRTAAIVPSSPAGPARWTESRTLPAATGCSWSRTPPTRSAHRCAAGRRGRSGTPAASASTRRRRWRPARAAWSRRTTRTWRAGCGCTPTTACSSAHAWARRSDRRYRHQEAVVPGFKCNMTDLEVARHPPARAARRRDRAPRRPVGPLRRRARRVADRPARPRGGRRGARTALYSIGCGSTRPDGSGTGSSTSCSPRASSVGSTSRRSTCIATTARPSVIVRATSLGRRASELAPCRSRSPEASARRRSETWWRRSSGRAPGRGPNRMTSVPARPTVGHVNYSFFHSRRLHLLLPRGPAAVRPHLPDAHAGVRVHRWSSPAGARGRPLPLRGGRRLPVVRRRLVSACRDPPPASARGAGPGRRERTHRAAPAAPGRGPPPPGLGRGRAAPPQRRLLHAYFGSGVARARAEAPPRHPARLPPWATTSPRPSPHGGGGGSRRTRSRRTGRPAWRSSSSRGPLLAEGPTSGTS